MTHGRPLGEDPAFAGRDFRSVSGNGSVLLADLHGQKGDLERAMAACKRALKVFAVRPLDLELSEMLWHYAIMSYGRCFSTGVRFSNRKSIEAALEPQQLSKHREFMDLRNKFVAHSVNGYEHDVPVMELAPRDGAEPGLRSVGVWSMRMTTIGPEPILELIAQARAVTAILERTIETLKNSMEAALRALPLDQLYEADVLTFGVSKDSGIHHPRPHMRQPKE